jgi:signal transduction histidine kinase
MTGEITAGIAHQIRNPLTTIVARTYLLSKRIPSDGPTRKALEIIRRSSYRAGTVVQRLLDFARPSPYILRPMDINQSRMRFFLFALESTLATRASLLIWLETYPRF